jgi:hypothetical protein
MNRISRSSLEAFLAYGNASIAVCEVNERVRRSRPDDRALELLAELKAAHTQLRKLFANGLDGAVCVLAQDIMELAAETADSLGQDQEPSGW